MSLSMVDIKYTKVSFFVVCCLTVLLTGCSSVSNKAPVVDKSTSSGNASSGNKVIPSSGDFYTVQKGDTLARIAAAHGKSWTELARLNNLTDPNQIEVGQQIRVRSESGSSTSASNNTTKANTPAAPVASSISWQWPAKGTVSESFMGKNRGIDIVAKEGDPVYAAADGKVMYAGNVRGYGNLLIIQHNSTYLTTYAHNKTLLVNEKQSVKAGQKIAEIGQTDTTSPRLRFEVRQNGNPVDPVSFLPKR